MRYLLAFLLVCLPLASCNDAQAVEAMNVALVADSLQVTVRFRVDARADSAVVRVSYPGQSAQKKVAASALSALLMLPAPAEGATITLTALVTAYKTGTPAVSTTKTRSYTRPVAPLTAPIVDTIEVAALEQAIGVSSLIGRTTMLVERTTTGTVVNTTCVVEQRSYYGAQLIIVRDSLPGIRHECESAALRAIARDWPPRLAAYNLAAIRYADARRTP